MQLSTFHQKNMSLSGFNNINLCHENIQVQPKHLHNDLIKALDAIKHEETSPIAAVNWYEIPSSIIYNRLSG